MDTFGPVWYLVYHESSDGCFADGTYTAPFCDHFVPCSPSGYFWGVRSDDDEKPVVHVKPVSRGGYRRSLSYGELTLPFYHIGRPVSGDRYGIGSWVSDGYTTVGICIHATSYREGPSPNNGWTNVGFKFYVTAVFGRVIDGAIWLARRRVRWTSGSRKTTQEVGGFGVSSLNSSFDLAVTTTFNQAWAQGWINTGNPGAMVVRISEYAYKKMTEQLLDWALDHMDANPVLGRSYNSHFVRVIPEYLSDELPESYRRYLKLGEDSISETGQPGQFGISLSNYWLNVLRSKSFVAACEDMPRLSDNSIANLSEVVEFILSVVRREPPKLPSSLGDIWLAYRYQYSTTKMDVKEAWAFINRYYDLGSINLGVDSYGVSRLSIDGVDVTCRCSLTCAPRHTRGLTDLSELWRTLSTYGLAPDLYYLWDSTPFSFIVDWFLPVGDVLAATDASMLYTSQNYSFSRIVYSLSYTYDNVKCYSRWCESNAPTISPLYWLEGREPPSRKQVLYRALDSASLLMGVF